MHRKQALRDALFEKFTRKTKTLVTNNSAPNPDSELAKALEEALSRTCDESRRETWAFT